MLKDKGRNNRYQCYQYDCSDVLDFSNPFPHDFLIGYVLILSI